LIFTEPLRSIALKRLPERGMFKKGIEFRPHISVSFVLRISSKDFVPSNQGEWNLDDRRFCSARVKSVGLETVCARACVRARAFVCVCACARACVLRMGHVVA
jgi:hypothetical protein